MGLLTANFFTSAGAAGDEARNDILIELSGAVGVAMASEIVIIANGSVCEGSDQAIICAWWWNAPVLLRSQAWPFVGRVEWGVLDDSRVVLYAIIRWVWVRRGSVDERDTVADGREVFTSRGGGHQSGSSNSVLHRD
jgi:hypothetical protein